MIIYYATILYALVLSYVEYEPFVKNNPLMVEPKSIQRIKDIFVGLAITFAR